MPYERDIGDGVPCGMGFRACGRGERIATTSLHPKDTCFAAQTGWE